MIEIYSNRIICTAGRFNENNLPTDLKMEIIALRPLLNNCFQTDTYHKYILESASVSLVNKGLMTTKLIGTIPQPTVQLVNSILEKAANL